MELVFALLVCARAFLKQQFTRYLGSGDWLQSEQGSINSCCCNLCFSRRHINSPNINVTENQLAIMMRAAISDNEQKLAIKRRSPRNAFPANNAHSQKRNKGIYIIGMLSLGFKHELSERSALFVCFNSL